MAIVTGDRYLEYLVKFVEKQAGPLLEGTLVLKLNPVGLHYVQSRLEALEELEGLLVGAPVDYLRAYISDLGDHRALEQLRRILRLLTSLKVVSVLPPPTRDPTPLSLLPFGRLKVLELRGCDLSTSAARGLLELRHTLEKIICHNSTDALRHVFASRIADIKESPVWNRLTFVSCACNDLLLMDESLQLLPVVETLDLSRNRFAKVDNLRKCSKLRYLDLGFNQLRTIASFAEISCSIVKLVLRNNALTTLRGIENLKSIEGLDLSYNIISNFSEIEILASLPSLQNLWLEGNPICCATWYRPQVFSFVPHPEKLKLDDKEITTKEFWKRQIVIASRQTRPPAFGFYSPAKYDANEEGSFNMKKKKLSRLACIEDEGQGRHVSLESTDQESISCDSEIRSREENAMSDTETEIVGLINRIEFMKKENSSLWLQEFKQWMDHSTENMVDSSKFTGEISSIDKENYMKNKKSHKNLGCVSNSVQVSAVDHTTNMLESDNSFTDTSIDLNSYQYFDSVGEVASESSEDFYHKEGQHVLRTGRMDSKQGQLRGYNHQEVNSLPVKEKDPLLPDRLIIQGGSMDRKVDCTPLTAIGEIIESYSSSGCPSSPPHYQEDILQRRHTLVEELMQLSADSYSVASSDSDTSCSGDNICDDDQILNEDSLNRSMEDHLHVHSPNNNYYDRRNENLHIKQNGRYSLGCHADQASTIGKLLKQDCSNNALADADCDETDHVMEQEEDCLEKRKFKRKPKRRIVPLLEENYTVGNSDIRYQKLNGTPEVGKIGMENGPRIQTFGRSDFQKAHEDKDRTLINSVEISLVDGSGKSISWMECSSHLSQSDETIKSYFHLNVADSRASEICLQCMRCDSILALESGYQERELVLLLSSENKLYVLLMDFTSNGSVVGCHRLEDVKEVEVGIGLHVLSVHFEMDLPYIFITRSIDKSRELLCLLQVCDMSATSNKCLLKSLEQIQVELFEKHVCTGQTMSMFLYSMLLFWHSNSKEESWLSRSLFIVEGYVLVCIEDLMQFSSLSMDDVSCSSYLTLDLCCSIGDISEMVIEPRESRCITLTLDSVSPGSSCSADLDKEKQSAIIKRDKMAIGSFTWKLKWFSEETLLKFVALLKAMHAATTLSPFPVRYAS
ncbi:uncharacterized protein LOC122645478 isoform X2 [Telopea speciosissima]|uniref:uncharacterized protein LOC122645478 isoform X2 n=1 Tax=Telopea speciosissima TaxID=54955 RepID=UPI001CC5D176|nr:uncharacterized protein LOC122645478 isoform X2 [Telopea speciosissima]